MRSFPSVATRVIGRSMWSGLPAPLRVRHSRAYIDTSDTPQPLAAYVRAIGLQSSGFLWTIDSHNVLARRYGISSLSSTVFLDSSGQAKFVNQGPQDGGTYAQQWSAPLSLLRNSQL